MVEKRPIVVIAVPATDTLCTGFGMSLAWLCVHAAKDFDLRPIHSKSSNVAIVRNNAVAAAKMHRAEWILWLDSDMKFPRDTLHRLMAHGKELVGATYPMRTPPYIMLGLASKREEADKQEGLLEMNYTPTGCFLMKMDVFKKMDRPYFRCPFNEVEITGEDVDFCERAREKGFQIWSDIDLSKEIRHIGVTDYGYDSPEVQKAMEDHKQAQAQAMITPISISVLIPSRGREEMLKMTIQALDHLASDHNKITYCVAADEDDVPTNLAAQALARATGNVNILLGPRPGCIGKLYNELARMNPADAYLPFADDIIPLVQDWDVIVAQGIQQYPVLAWHDHFNGRFPSYPIISREWYEAAGEIFCEHFPFWFNDTYLNEVVAMVTGKPISIATDLPLGGRRGRTHRLRDLGIWVDLFRELRAERLDKAAVIAAKVGVDPASVGKMALAFEQNDLYLARNIDRFEAMFGEDLPPSEEYLAVLESAKARLSGT